MKQLWLIIIFSLFASGTVMAAGVDKNRFTDPAMEDRAQELMKQLRCLVCQNQSIVDSDAELAQDLRAVVRERIIAGDDDKQILGYMTARYGDWVLLKPPVNTQTYLLWAAPVIFLLLGGIGFWVYLRRPEQEGTAEAPLSEREKQHLKQIMEDDA